MAGIFACFSDVSGVGVGGGTDAQKQEASVGQLVRWSRPFLVSDPQEVTEVDASSDPAEALQGRTTHLPVALLGAASGDQDAGRAGVL